MLFLKMIVTTQETTQHHVPKHHNPLEVQQFVSSMPLQIKFYWHLIEVRDRYSRVFGSNPAADMKDNRSTLDFLENCHCLRVC